VAQAVSLVKAEQTGLWHMAPDGTEIERRPGGDEPHYDFEEIHREVTALEGDDVAWSRWFEHQRINPLRVQFEKLADDPGRTLVDICGALRVAAPAVASVKPGVAKLSDELNLDWMGQYRSEIGTASRTCDPPSGK
jgi:LPS sulfotransferase NodH